MKVGIAADHGGFTLKQVVHRFLQDAGHEVTDFGAHEFSAGDDYPDLVEPLARAVGQGQVERGIALCGSGVGACIVANKIQGVRACLITEHFSAHQGVEDDDMNLICLGGRITGEEAAKEFISSFLSARFKTEDKYLRRLNKVKKIENRP